MELCIERKIAGKEAARAKLQSERHITRIAVVIEVPQTRTSARIPAIIKFLGSDNARKRKGAQQRTTKHILVHVLLHSATPVRVRERCVLQSIGAGPAADQLDEASFRERVCQQG